MQYTAKNKIKRNKMSDTISKYFIGDPMTKYVENLSN